MIASNVSDGLYELPLGQGTQRAPVQKWKAEAFPYKKTQTKNVRDKPGRYEIPFSDKKSFKDKNMNRFFSQLTFSYPQELAPPSSPHSPAPASPF